MDAYFENGKKILNILTRHGFKAFFVGGFVRDYLLGIKANDIDITTDALPSQIEAIFDRTKPTGKRYGTISVFVEELKYEVTTFRADIEYIDFRHPERVVFSTDLKEDLERRDFTINAFAMDSEEQITDLFSGRQDLQNRIIRAIGNPDTRFNEDALRMLRAFRFVSKLNFDIEQITLTSINKNVTLLKKISNERIILEIKEIFKYKYYVKALKLLGQINIKNAFPELENSISVLKQLEEYELDYVNFFAMSFYLANSVIPSYWRFSNRETEMINNIINILKIIETRPIDKMLVYNYGEHNVLAANKIAVILNMDVDQRMTIKSINKKLPIHKLSDVFFNGEDVLNLLNGKRGNIVGAILKKVEMEIVNGSLENDFEIIKEYVHQIVELENER